MGADSRRKGHMAGFGARRSSGVDHARLQARAWRNRLQTLLLLAAMATLLGLCGWLIAGVTGLVWVAAVGGTSTYLAARVSPRLVLRMFRAAPLPRHELPELHRIVAELSQRAGLPRVPSLNYIGSRTLNAFSVGTRENGAISITTGLLRSLNLREIAGVLAHEISHLANNDTRVMALADVMVRMTRVMSLLGVGLLLLNLPLVMMGQAGIPWLLVLLLTFAPTLLALLQLALSRTREFDADLEAARLTGDPIGLAQALSKLERYQGAFWEDLFAPGRRSPDPSLLRTHPKTEERIERLKSLQKDIERPMPSHWRGAALPQFPVPPALERPRWHRTGVWY